MPWISHCKSLKETPAHYTWPSCLSGDTILGRNIEFAKMKRKEIGQLRESLLNYQKEAVKNKDLDLARYFSNECAELMKQYRGWDGAIKMIECTNDWLHRHIAEQIARYVDMAFMIMDLNNNNKMIKK